jgi:hypothetical protein
MKNLKEATLAVAVSFALYGCSTSSPKITIDNSMKVIVNGDMGSNQQEVIESAKVKTKEIREEEYIKKGDDAFKALTKLYVGPHAQENFKRPTVKQSLRVVNTCMMPYNLPIPSTPSSQAIRGKYGIVQMQWVENLMPNGKNKSGSSYVYYMDDDNFRQLANDNPAQAEKCLNSISAYAGIDMNGKIMVDEKGKPLPGLPDYRIFTPKYQNLQINFLQNLSYFRGIVKDGYAGKNVIIKRNGVTEGVKTTTVTETTFTPAKVNKTNAASRDVPYTEGPVNIPGPKTQEPIVLDTSGL